MEPRIYLHMQMRLEGKRVAGDHLLTQLPNAEEPCPLVLLARLSTGEQEIFVHETLTPELRASIIQQQETVTFPDVDPLLRLLAEHGFVVAQSHYTTYCFPSATRDAMMPQVQRYAKTDPRIVAFGFDGFADDIYAVTHGGQIASACVSARENDQCGEAWVMTYQDYRKQGYALMTVQAWARSLMLAGKVPFYSHKSDNEASARVAHRLGLAPIFEEVSIQQRGGRR